MYARKMHDGYLAGTRHIILCFYDAEYTHHATSIKGEYNKEWNGAFGGRRGNVG
jgi:hypothetical protein